MGVLAEPGRIAQTDSIMSQHFTTETFFIPEEVSRERVSLSAGTFNLYRLLLSRGGQEYFFVPIRSMQFLAIITNDEILFVDSQDYAVKDGEGGRLVVLSWQTESTGRRSSLDEPVPVEVIYYKQNAEQIQSRLMSEFPRAMKDIQQRKTGFDEAVHSARVIPFRT